MQNAFSYVNSQGVEYFLHSRNVNLKNGRQQTIYFFARDVREGALSEVPAGFEVFETSRSHMPVLRKAQ